MGNIRVVLARIVGAIGGGCGIIGVLAAYSGRTLILGQNGWFLLGILAVVSALTIFFDENQGADR